MSSLDFGAGIGANPGFPSRSYNIATVPQIRDGDYCFGAWSRRNFAASAAEFPHMVSSQNDPNPAEGYVLYEHGPSNTYQGVCFALGGTGTTRTFSVPASGDSSIYLSLFQRRGANWEFYVTKKGEAAGSPSTDAVTGTTIAESTPMRIGNSSFGSDGWLNPLGEFFFLDNLSLTAAQITMLAAGARPSAENVGVDPLILLAFRNGPVDIEPNIGRGGARFNATRVGTGFTLGPDFFSDQAPSHAALGDDLHF